MPDADTLAHYRTLVKDTTIDGNTLLSTDYFNHFNEVIMLLSMLGDMPDMLDEIRAWQPKTYKQHFEGSGLGFAALAIDAYDHVPPEYRQSFDRVIAELEATIAEAVVVLEAELGSPEVLGFMASDYWQRLQKLVDRGSAIVHGATEQATLDQDAIDALF